MRAVLKMRAWILVVLLASTGLLLATGCGGGGGGGLVPSPPVGQVAFGPLDGAQVQIYRVEGDGTFALLDTQISSSGTQVPEVGMFDPSPVAMSPGELYLFKATGGQIVDADHDGVLDGAPTGNGGAVHALVFGSQATSGDVRLTTLTEILYQRLRYMLVARYPTQDILQALNRLAPVLLDEDVDGSGAIDSTDVVRWNPATQETAVRKAIDLHGDIFEAMSDGKDGWVAWESQSLADSSVAFRYFDDEVQDVHIVGDRAYVAIRDTGFAILDVSDPRNPTELATVTGLGEGEDIGVQGDFLYYAHRDGGPIGIFDVSVPATPVARGTLPADEPDCLLPDGNLLYAADRDSSLIRIVDITDPDTPFQVSSIPTLDDPNQMDLVGSYLYVADTDWLTVIDVSDPAAPFIRASIEGLDGDMDGVKVAGNHAYCADGSAGLLVVDVSDLDNLQVVANVPSRSECDRIWIDGNRLYMCASEAGVQVIDILTPTAPVHLGYIAVAPRARVAVVSGGYAYVACDEGGLRVVDLAESAAVLYADPLDDLVLGTIDTGTGNMDVVADGNYAYVAKDDGLSIVDLSDPTNPALAWSGTFAAGDSEAVARQGNLLYVAAEGGGLQIVDITDPLSPDLKAPFALSDRAMDVVVAGNLAYVADRHGDGFVIVDVTDPDAPVRVGDVLAPGGEDVTGVAVQGTHAFCAWSDTGLVAIDVSDPAAPEIVDTLMLHDVGSVNSSDANKVVVSGDYAYVVADELHVVNISDPSDLTLEVTFEIDVWDDDVALSGEFGFVAGSTGGVLVLDTSDLSDPELVARLPTLGDSRSAFVHGDLLLISNKESGLTILRAPITADVP